MPINAKKPMTPEAALIRLEEACARAEQCTGELRQKLRSWQIGDADADTIIRSLVRRRFVDDRRFAAAFTADKYRFLRWGRRKIEMALRQKRIPSDIIAEALEQIDKDEYAASLSYILVQKLPSATSATPYETRLKLYRFAVARGFEPSLVSDAIDDIMS